MTALNKQALREAAVNAKIAGEAPVMPFDQRIDALNSFTKLLTPATAIALLDENESLVRANSAQDDHINQQQDRIDRLERGSHEAAKQISSWRQIAKQNIAEREKDIAELCAARQRIAELEEELTNVKAKALYWDADNTESSYEDPADISGALNLNPGDHFYVQVAYLDKDKEYIVNDDGSVSCTQLVNSCAVTAQKLREDNV
ncbi:hypothetical protein [Edwardsiella piscicida]|uniref:hypothetical protein n=1 Tax=Edwardsiella piscicida TaxID=1263550 RepID=UPI00370D6BAF